MNAMKGRTTMKKKIRIFARLLVVAMLLSAFAYAHEETDSAKIHLTGETLSEADDVQAIGNRAIFISTQNKIASVDDSQQEYVAEYVPEYQIEFAIPYQNKGVMIGSEKPTMHSVRAVSYTHLSSKYPLFSNISSILLTE